MTSSGVDLERFSVLAGLREWVCLTLAEAGLVTDLG